MDYWGGGGGGGGGGKGYVAPLSNYWGGGGAGPTLTTPMNSASCISIWSTDHINGQLHKTHNHVHTYRGNRMGLSP